MYVNVKYESIYKSKYSQFKRFWFRVNIQLIKTSCISQSMINTLRYERMELGCYIYRVKCKTRNVSIEKLQDALFYIYHIHVWSSDIRIYTMTYLVTYYTNIHRSSFSRTDSLINNFRLVVIVTSYYSRYPLSTRFYGHNLHSLWQCFQWDPCVVQYPQYRCSDG